MLGQGIPASEIPLRNKYFLWTSEYFNMSRVEVKLEMSCRTNFFYAAFKHQFLLSILFFQPICSTLCLCDLFILILGAHGTEFVDVICVSLNISVIVD